MVRCDVAFFGFGKDKKDSGSSELVLAYLEDAQRVRTPFLLGDKRRNEIPAMLQGIDEESGSLSFQTQGGTFEKGASLDFLFIQEGLRLGGTTQVTEVRPNTVVADLPDELELRERRKCPRARLNPKEGANVTALTNLFEGVGVNGAMENISEGGCRIRVEKAINIKDEKRLHLGKALLPVGQPFMLLKLNKVPKCPAVMELTGRVSYLDDREGLSIGIEFDKPRGDYASAIRSLVNSRSGSIPSSLPPKTRRKAMAQEDTFLAEPRERAVRPVVQKPPPPEPPPPEPREPAAPKEPDSRSEEAPSPVPEISQAPPRNPALLRLKKRTRAIVILANAAYGQILREFLLEDGYGRIFLAANREELSDCIRQPNVGMVFIDNEMSILECLEMVTRMAGTDQELPPVIVAAEEVSRSLVLAARRAGVSQLVVKPYTLDETFSSLLEQVMGL